MHTLLQQQLRRLDLDSSAVPDPVRWSALLDRIERTYADNDRSRYLVERSLETSSLEMSELYEELRRASARAAAAQHDRLETVVHAVGDGLCALEADGRIAVVNPEAVRLLAGPGARLVGQGLGEVVRVTRAGDSRLADRDGFAQALAAGRPWRSEHALFVRADGVSFPASCVLNPIRGEAGAQGSVLVFRDVSARLRADEQMRRQRDYSEALVASMKDGLTVLSPEGVITEVSPSFSQMTGFAREELIGAQCPYPYWPEAEPEAIERGFARIRETGAGEWDLEFRRKNGERFPVILSGSLLRAEDGEVVGYLATVKDVTERKRAERELLQSAADHQALAAEQAALRRVATAVAGEAEPREIFALVAREIASLLGVEAGAVVRFVDDERGLVVGTSRAETGASAGVGVVVPLGTVLPLRGSSATGRVHQSGRPARMDDSAALDGETAKLFVATTCRSGVAAPIRVGSEMWGAIAALTSRPELLPGGSEQRLSHFAELVGVAIANADARSQLAALAATDPLTGLPNRRALEAWLEAAVETAGSGARPLSALVLDLDSFKQVNDLHGHEAGDAVLCAVARTLEAGCRLGDLAGRLGGEEFLVVLPDASSRTAWLVAERLRGAIAALDFDGSPGVTASFGVACFPAHGTTAAGLLRAADNAMYDAKELGRNRSIVFDPRTAASRTERTELAQAGREGYLGSVIALAAAVDARDAWTHAHSETVARYAAAIASHLGLDGDQVEEVRIAGLLHDVGKVGVPDSVLHKPGPLDDAEWDEMRRHPAIGARILTHPALADVREWVLRHHERPDGRGYPDGLEGVDIPLGARILAVADAYEAMTADRPYRDRLSSKAARAELTRGRGTQFDAEVVDAFLASLALTPAPTTATRRRPVRRPAAAAPAGTPR